jgi:hypothetical protein
LAAAPDPVSPAGLIPSNRYVDETLMEIALGRLGLAPRGLELFMSREELAAADQREPAFERFRP